MLESSLANRNVTIAGRRTSMKLEPDMWDALDEICYREKATVHEVCTQVARHHHGNNLTAAIRVFILSYFRKAATDDGHLLAGHGLSTSFAPSLMHTRSTRFGGGEIRAVTIAAGQDP